MEEQDFQDLLIQATKDRFLFLMHLFELSGRKHKIYFEAQMIGAALKFSPTYTRAIIAYLLDEGLLQKQGLQGPVALTFVGLTEMEEALKYPNSPTRHFPPVVEMMSKK